MFRPISRCVRRLPYRLQLAQFRLDHGLRLCHQVALDHLEEVAHVVDQVEDALPQVSLVVTATTATSPVLPDLDSGLWRDDHFIAAVGAFRPEMCELPPALCLQAASGGHLIADTFSGIQHEAGDLLQAGVDWATLREFKDAILLDPRAIRDRDGCGPVVFKSVGYALWDLAAASLVVG